MDQLQISPNAETALQQLQDTKLNPMEEALFKSWTKANQIVEPDAKGDVMDYRGIWKATNGQVLPHGELKKKAEFENNIHTLERELQQRMMDRVSEMAGKEEDLRTKQFDAEQKSLDHDRKMEQGHLKLKQAPFEVKKAEHSNAGKELDIQKQRVGLQAQELGNKGKQIDLIASMLQPAPATQPMNPSSGNTSNKR